MLIGLCAGLGNGAIFKLVPLYFSQQSGIANGLISALGGLGGFFPPLMLTMLFSVTGHYAIGFMALAMVALCSLLLVLYLFWQDKVKVAEQMMHSTSQAVLITNKLGYIVAVNQAFTAVTGYTPEMAVGQKSSILQSGRHNQAFYASMWKQLLEQDTWVGQISNKKSNGDIYLEHLTIHAVKDDFGGTSYYVGVFKEIGNPVA
jgi:NNP family nitrate/nitrite transporter-like MFS transporter